MPDIDPIKVKVQVEYDPSGIDKAKEDLASLAEIGGGVQAGAENASAGLAGLDEQAVKNAGSAKTLNEALGELPKVFESGEASVSSFGDTLAGQQRVIEDTAQSLSDIQEPLKSYNESLQAVSETVSSPHLAENMSAFQDALQNPYPFSMVQQYLAETGQSWGDFTSSIGEENTSFLHEMATNADRTHQVLGGMSSDVQSVNKTFTESASSADEFTKQFNGMGAAASDAGKAVEGAGNVIADAGGAMESFGGLGDALSSTMSGMSEFFGGMAMPAMMAMQMIVPMVTQAAQGIYDMAAIAEGPAAHSMGTFTGQVDALGQTSQHVAGQFSESFGRQIIPTIDAMNYQMSQSAGTAQDLGGNLGAFSSFLANLGSTIEGPALMMNPLTFGLGLSMTQAGFAGMINQGASAIGLQEPFQGPGVSSQTTYDVVSVVHQQTIQTRQQIDTLLGDASDPGFLDQQNRLSAAQQIYQRMQQSYDISHPINQYEMLRQFQEQQYDQQQAANYQYQMQNPTYAPTTPGTITGYWTPEHLMDWLIGPKVGDGGLGKSISDWWNSLFGGGGGVAVPATTSTGCFPAGTRVRMANGTEKAIETLQIGEQVLAYDGEKQVTTAILALIKPPPKQVYELTFSDGNTLTLTDSHPIMTAQGWKSISPESTEKENPGLVTSRLMWGNVISTTNGTCQLVSITPLQWRVQVYNITVDEPHTFYANNILVHNKVVRAEIGQQVADQIGDIQLPHIDLSNMTAGLASAFSGITLPSIPNLGGEINGALSGMFGGISLPAIPDIGGMLSGALSGMFGGISLPSIPDIGGMLNGAMSGMFGGIEPPQSPNVGGMINGAMSGMFEGITIPSPPNLGAMISGAMSGMFGGISLPSIPFFASGIEGFGGGLAVVGDRGPELVSLPGGSSVYPLTTGSGIGGSVSPIPLGGGGGSMPQSINVSVHLDSQTILSAIGMPMAQNIRLASGMRAF